MVTIAPGSGGLALVALVEPHQDALDDAAVADDVVEQVVAVVAPHRHLPLAVVQRMQRPPEAEPVLGPARRLLPLEKKGELLHAHPDFVVLHPRRGLLILEVKDWRLETIRTASKQTWEIFAQGIPKSVPNPIEQARHYAHQVVDALSRDQRLTNADGKLLALVIQTQMTIFPG